MNRANSDGIVLLGCGKMGSAMLQGWLNDGLSSRSVTVLDPHPSDWVLNKADEGLNLNGELPDCPAVVIIAIKPQMMGEALPRIAALGNGRTVFISIAAGTSLATLAAVLGNRSPIVRAMPNTPAAIGQGITAYIGNEHVNATDLAMSEELLRSIGQTLPLDTEEQINAVTAVSGSGPAYVFHLIETLAAAGEAEGLLPDMAMTLACATVAGAGALAIQSDEPPSQLRKNVTSPGGTTAAGLQVLMDQTHGFPHLLQKAVEAAANRARELAE